MMRMRFAPHTVRIRFVLAAALCAALATMAPGLRAQDSKPQAAGSYQFKIGVLPFVDNTGTGNDATGPAVSRAVQAELTHSTKLIGRALKLDDGVSADAVDSDKAVEIGKSRNVDVVVVGLVLEATSEESEKGISTGALFGQSVGGHARSVKASITLQGDLYNVSDGSKIDSFRVSGHASETKVGADVSTDLGGISTDGSTFDSSPIGKAMNAAVAELVKKINASQGKMIRNK